MKKKQKRKHGDEKQKKSTKRIEWALLFVTSIPVSLFWITYSIRRINGSIDKFVEYDFNEISLLNPYVALIASLVIGVVLLIKTQRWWLSILLIIPILWTLFAYILSAVGGDLIGTP